MIPESPVPTKLPSTAPVRPVLVREVWPVPLLIVRRPLVFALKALSEMGTLSPVICHEPPALVPAPGIDTVAARLRVRLVKFASMRAEPSVPVVLFWLVGDVAAARVYV